ncbi:MAG: hypothetical protein AAFY71_03910 [Bacteroidota bacterium]
MNFRLYVCLLSLLLTGKAVFAQFDSIPMIHVDKQEVRQTEQRTPFPSDGDFIRRTNVHRLDLDVPGNQCLLLGKHEDKELSDKGLVDIILKEIREGNLKGSDAGNFRQGYGYMELLKDIYVLEGREKEWESDTLDLSRIDWSWLTKYVDLIVEEGFSKDNSRYFMRVKFVRLIWFHPEHPRGLHGVTYFPYEAIQEELGRIICSNGWSMKEILQFKAYQYESFPIDQDQKLTPTLRKP